MKQKLVVFLLSVGLLFSPFLIKAQHTITATNDFLSIATSNQGGLLQALNNDFYNNPNGNNGDSIFILFVSAPKHITASSSSGGIGNPDIITYNSGTYGCGYDTFFYVIGDTATPTITDTAWVYVVVGTPPVIPVPVSITPSVCTGQTISFSCTPGSDTPNWSHPSNGFGSTLASGSISNAVFADSGLYQVHLVSSSGCVGKDTVLHVTVKQAPSKPVASLSVNPVCLTKTTTLSFTPTTSSSTISWTGPNAFVSATQSNVLAPITANHAGKYFITVDLNGCSKTDSIILQVNSCPVPNSGYTTVNDTICSGGSIAFTDTSGNNPSSWSWSFNTASNVNVTCTPVSSILKNPSVVFTNSSSTLQTVQISMQASNANGNGVSFTSHPIYVRPSKPVTNFSASTVTVCQGTTVNFTDLSTNAPDTWAWNLGSGTPSSSTTQHPTNITFNNLGQTTITLTSSNKCGSNSKNLNINVITVPTPSFTYSTTNPVCSYNPINFTDGSLNATTWSWTFGDGKTSLLQNPVDTYFTAGKYYVNLVATNICGSSPPYIDSIVVKNCSKPVAYFTVFNDTVCMNSPVQFADSSSNKPFITNWIIPNATYIMGSTPNDTMPFVSFNSSGVYPVKEIVQNLYGKDTFTRNIVVLRCLPPVASFFGNVQVCEGQCANFINTSSEFPDTYLWKFSNASYDTTSKFTPKEVCYNIVGVFQVDLIACNIYGCDTISNFITVLPSPHVLSLDTCIEAGYTVKLWAHGNGEITWMPNITLNTNIGDTVNSTPVNKITYTVHDTTSCPSPDSVTICLNYTNTELNIPNVFTPDGNGLNDIFKVASNIPLLEFNMKIYNRWGVKVFESSDYNVGWDGTFNNTQQNSGVFVYMMSYRDLGNNEYKTLKGNITLIK
ncbi:MAG: hypothetical protein RIQ33_132 [Bacteroidota bacterium]